MADEKSGKLAFPEPQHHYAAPSDPPPQYEAGSSSFAPAAAGAPPPAGHRVPCSTENNAPMPSIESIGPAPFNDLDGSPVYVVSALIMDQRTGSVQAVHPAKANARFTPPVRLSYGGASALNTLSTSHVLGLTGFFCAHRPRGAASRPIRRLDRHAADGVGSGQRRQSARLQCALSPLARADCGLLSHRCPREDERSRVYVHMPLVPAHCAEA